MHQEKDGELKVALFSQASRPISTLFSRPLLPPSPQITNNEMFTPDWTWIITEEQIWELSWIYFEMYWVLNRLNFFFFFLRRGRDTSLPCMVVWFDHDGTFVTHICLDQECHNPVHEGLSGTVPLASVKATFRLVGQNVSGLDFHSSSPALSSGI